MKARKSIDRHSQRFVLLLTSPFLLSTHAVSFAPDLPSIDQSSDVGMSATIYATATLPGPANLIASTPGSIRVSNATYHPIRIALLPQVQPALGIASTLQQVASSQHTDIESHDISPNAVPIEQPQEQPQYGEPIHWDFVPREGADTGLVLAVAEGHVKVQPGDVLTAFAQDGSRRYWGPYVVGMTESPVWNSETQEWSLVLETGFPW